MEALGVEVGPAPWAPAAASELIAAVEAVITFPGMPNARVIALEDVDMRRDSADPRCGYIYQFIADGRSVFDYHRQADHDPCDHRHEYDPPSVTPATRTLAQVVREAQAYMSPGLFPEETRFPRPPGLT